MTIRTGNRIKIAGEAKERQMTINGVFRYVVPKHHRGVLCCENVIRFHGTRINVSSLMPIIQVLPSFALSSMKLKNGQQHCVRISYITPNFTAKSGVDLSLHP
jgi:hypothetical protein